MIVDYKFIDFNKNLFSSLIKLYGIGFSRANYICKYLGLDCFKKYKYLNNNILENISNLLSRFNLSESLKLKVKNNINKLIYIKCYKGQQHLNINRLKKPINKNNKNSKPSIKKKVNVNFKKKNNKKK